ncbi:MAG: hypothetical protein M5R42_01475 [Rhodocyclaceae bacterium]|nr:hypothetical protein [Rhodocyclaceae bacterium]
MREAVQNFYKHQRGQERWRRKAAGMLVFPSVVKAGIGIDGEYGEVRCSSAVIVAYYNIAARLDRLPALSAAPPRQDHPLHDGECPGQIPRRSGRLEGYGGVGSVALATLAPAARSTTKRRRSRSSASSSRTRA